MTDSNSDWRNSYFARNILISVPILNAFVKHKELLPQLHDAARCVATLSGSIAAMSYYAGYDDLAGNVASMVGGMFVGGALFNVTWDASNTLYKHYQLRRQLSDITVIDQDLEALSLQECENGVNTLSL